MTIPTTKATINKNMAWTVLNDLGWVVTSEEDGCGEVVLEVIVKNPSLTYRTLDLTETKVVCNGVGAFAQNFGP